MIDISVCVGSSCHIKGSHAVITAVGALIDEYRLTDKVKLKASFCQGRCIDGVCVTVGETVITGVNADNVREKFETEIMPLLP